VVKIVVNGEFLRSLFTMIARHRNIVEIAHDNKRLPAKVIKNIFNEFSLINLKKKSVLYIVRKNESIFEIIDHLMLF
jgi:hypothetical protein